MSISNRNETKMNFIITKYFQQKLVIFGVLLLCHLSASHQQQNSVHSIFKRMDIASCLGKAFFYHFFLYLTTNNFFVLILPAKFDVKTDMIIRTEESRKLGAKFLVISI